MSTGTACLRPIWAQSLRISASIGISVFPKDGGNMEELPHNADVAIYDSKHSGRNTFRFHS